jgi:hypothetical protein
MNAPVCPISRSQPIAAMPGRQMPVVPRAADLASLIAAVNALRQQMQGFAGPGPPANNMPLFVPNLNPRGAIVAVRSNWTEVDRTTRQVRIFHHDENGKKDETMFVDVIRLQEIMFWDNFGGDEEFHWVQKTSPNQPDDQ